MAKRHGLLTSKRMAITHNKSGFFCDVRGCLKPLATGVLLAALLTLGCTHPVEARRKKAVATDKRMPTQTTDKKAGEHSGVWQTAQGAVNANRLKGQLSRPQLLDSALVQLWPVDDDAIIGLTQAGTVFKAKAGANGTLTTVWRNSQTMAPISLTVQHQTVWVSTGGESPRLLAFDADSGAAKASVSLTMPTTLSTLDDTRLLLMMDNGHAVAWDSIGQRILWDTNLKSPVMAPPLVTPTGVYVADLVGIARKLNPASGQITWEFGLGGPYEATPVITPDGSLLMLPCQVGTVFGVQPDTGQRLMSHTLPEGTPFLAAGVASNHILIAADEQGQVFALERQSNRRIWQHRLNGRVTYPLLMAGQHVVVSQTDGHVQSLDASTGKTDWSLTVPGILSTSPVLTRQHLWLGTLDGRLLFVD